MKDKVLKKMQKWCFNVECINGGIFMKTFKLLLVLGLTCLAGVSYGMEGLLATYAKVKVDSNATVSAKKQALEAIRTQLGKNVASDIVQAARTFLLQEDIAAFDFEVEADRKVASGLIKSAIGTELFTIQTAVKVKREDRKDAQTPEAEAFSLAEVTTAVTMFEKRFGMLRSHEASLTKTIEAKDVQVQQLLGTNNELEIQMTEERGISNARAVQIELLGEQVALLQKNKAVLVAKMAEIARK